MAAALTRYGGRERLGARVDVVEHRAVDADRGVRAGVVRDARVDAPGQLVPVPQRRTGVAALDAAVEVVPVVQQPERQARPLRDVQRLDRPPRLNEPQEMEDAVQRARLSLRCDDSGRSSADRRRSDEVALVTEACERLAPAEACDDGGRRRCAHDEGARGGDRVSERDIGGQHPAQSALQFAGHDAPGRRIRGRDDRRNRPAIGGLGPPRRQSACIGATGRALSRPARERQARSVSIASATAGRRPAHIVRIDN